MIGDFKEDTTNGLGARLQSAGRVRCSSQVHPHLDDLQQQVNLDHTNSNLESADSVTGTRHNRRKYHGQAYSLASSKPRCR